MRFITIIFFTILSLSAMANIKESFIKALKLQCSKTQDEAEKMATGGRTGNLVKYRLCNKGHIKLDDTCRLKCIDTSSSIGD